MLDSLTGSLTRRTPTEVVVECGGVGYRVLVSLRTAEALARHCSEQAPGEDPPRVRLWVHPHYTETEHRLFGFWTEIERELFVLLQAVRGVGPTLARAILSHESAEALLSKLRAGDTSGLTMVKGIGRKTAERMVLELKDRLPAAPVGDGRRAPDPDPVEGLVRALTSLGVPPSEAQQAAERSVEEHPAGTPLEVHLRFALQQRVRGAGRG